MTADDTKTMPSELIECPENSHLGRVARFPGIIGTFMARDALSLAASYLELAPNDAVLLPVYNCQDVLKAFVRTNRVVFYDVQADLTVNPKEIVAKLERGGIRMMMITNYFGFLQPHRDDIRQICQERGISLIEDCAHSLLTEGSGETGDLSIYSFRKILPIPDGGGLRINRARRPPKVKFHHRVFSDFLSALIIIKEFFNVRSNNFSRARFADHTRKLAPEITSRPKEPRILPLSHFAQKGMTNLFLPEIIERRRKDFQFWQEFCRGRKSLAPIFSDLPKGVCPLGFPVLVQDRRLVESRARKAGIVLRVHWRLDPMLGTECRTSHELASQILTLPLYPELKDRERRLLGEILALSSE
jgi:dTDP-4-amino-4,6-dideoxygalactose transaminase